MYDHVYATFEYPLGRTAVFTSIESNAFDHYYEMFMGTKGKGPALDASESRVADAAGVARSTVPEKANEAVEKKTRLIV